MDTYENGPDQLIPSENMTTTEASGAVKLKIITDATDSRSKQPISVVSLIKGVAKNAPNSLALATKRADGTWKKMTYHEYHQKIRTCAKAFIELGLERFQTVCIIGFNSEEWFIADLAAIYAGGMAAGIYTTNSPEACFYCIDSSNASIVVVEDQKQLNKILEIRSRLPKLKAIIQYTGTPIDDPMIYSWETVMKIGKEQPDSILDNVVKKIAVNQCCTLVYTSGTVGNPKAVMLSHDNVVWMAKNVVARLEMSYGTGAIVSYLPLSHIAAQLIDLYIPLTTAVAIYFADKNALKGSLLGTLQEVQPTYFLGVPRVWEKIHEKMTVIASQNSLIKRLILNWARGQGLQHHNNKMNGNPTNTWGYSLAKNLVFSKVRQNLGFAKCTHLITGAAPLSDDIKKYFLSLDLVLLEAFGMSEATGPHTLSTNNEVRTSSVGKSLNGMFTKIVNKDKDGNGEICFYGRQVFMGYLNDPVKTAEAVDDDGWLHSGDIGKMDADGYVYVTGRIKELIITAGGENIAPVNIENLIKTELPEISNAVLIGDRRKFLSILLTLKTNMDPDTGCPLDTIQEQTRKWLMQFGCEDKTVTEVLRNKNKHLLAAIQEGIDRVNSQAVSNAQRIQKFQILPVDFSIPTGELGPTLKLKRNVITEKYSDVIDALYK